MRVTRGILASLIGVCMLSASGHSAETGTAAFYQGLEPGAFMKEWLLCGPFPVFEGSDQPDDPAVPRRAFDRDFLIQHGGETQIQPTPEMVHQWDGKDYRWLKAVSRTDTINLISQLGFKEHAAAYAWARIDMPSAMPAVLGIGSDDAVKVWLNGELVHENWADRPVRPDDDLVAVTFRAGPNHLLFKVQNGRQLWGFACRLLDAETLADKLFDALNRGDLDAVQTCLSHGARVTATDKYGFTPVQVAQMRGHDGIVQLLVAEGADPNVALPEAGTPIGFLKLLWDSLKENYPMMEYAGAFDDGWYDACKREIQDIPALYDALPVIDAMIVRRLNDYHTGLHWEGKPSLIGPPIRTEWIENRVVVTECPKALGIAPGDIVLEIDGADAAAWFAREWPVAFGATPYARARSACRTILEGEPDSQVRLKLSNRHGETYEKVLTRGRGYEFRPEPVLSSRVINDRVGYIRIRAWGGFLPPEFDRLLEPLREKPCLIIDVRDNGGGSDGLAETVIGRFITRKVVASISFQRQAGTNLYEKIVFVVNPRGPWCYPGKVAVLTNEGCASACQHFVSGMFEAGALLVGTPSSGACGWSKGIDLPAGVTLRCALTFPLHGKVPSPQNGIPPHHLVTPTIEDLRAGRDTVLEKALAELNSPDDRES
jgi:C-terminal processing protease CtpA/Prc